MADSTSTNDSANQPANEARKHSSSSSSSGGGGGGGGGGSAAVAKQRAHIDYLMKNIEKPIDLPAIASKRPAIKPPPDIVLNVRGSSAGAGSSDFHTYRELRRKENLRVKLMEADAAEDLVARTFSKELNSLKRQDDEKTAKNRAKRLKRNKSKTKSSSTKKVDDST
ncbi:PRKR-interacting protein 1 [Coemansia sp. RSA 2320]|nr:PRKR-interacting protein 1 [Coemansia sp. RSA 2320]